MKSTTFILILITSTLSFASDWETVSRNMSAANFYQLLPPTMSAEGKDPLVRFTGANVQGVECQADILRSRYGHEITILYKDQDSWNEARRWSRLSEEYSSYEGTYEVQRIVDEDSGVYHIAGFYTAFGRRRGSLQLNSQDGKLTAVFITDRFNEKKRNCIAGKTPSEP